MRVRQTAGMLFANFWTIHEFTGEIKIPTMNFQQIYIKPKFCLYAGYPNIVRSEIQLKSNDYVQ